MNKIYISIIVLLLIVIITCSSYYVINNKRNNIIGNGFFMNTVESAQSSITPNSSIVQPKVNNSMTIHFGLLVKNFYMNHLRWKHLFHKGTNKISTFDYKYWYNVEQDLPKQTIGAWLHPDKNMMRITVSTLIKYDHKPLDYPLYDTIKKSLKANAYKETIEVCDIDNIEPNTLNYYTIVLDGQTLSIYKNGSLIKTCGLRGEVLLNMGDMYFNYHKTYSGKLINFAYIPKSHNPKKVKKLYNQLK